MVFLSTVEGVTPKCIASELRLTLLHQQQIWTERDGEMNSTADIEETVSELAVSNFLSVFAVSYKECQIITMLPWLFFRRKNQHLRTTLTTQKSDLSFWKATNRLGGIFMAG